MENHGIFQVFILEGTVGIQLGQPLAQSKAKLKGWADIQEWQFL